HHDGLALGMADVEHQAVAGEAQMQRERALGAAQRRKAVLFQEIVDRNGALVLDLGTRSPDRIFVERHLDEALGFRGAGAAHRGLNRIATERAWASRPSASPSAIAAPPSARSCSGPHLRIDVRFMKSSTPSPEEKRAERAVGST